MSTEITRSMELTIMLEGKEFKSNGLLRIFRKSNGILRTYVKHMNG